MQNTNGVLPPELAIPAAKIAKLTISMIIITVNAAFKKKTGLDNTLLATLPALLNPSLLKPLTILESVGKELTLLLVYLSELA